MKLHYIQTGEVQIKSRHRQARHEARLARMADVLMDPNWTPRLPVGCWLIEHPEGLIVVDTGAAAHLKSLPRWHPYFRFAVSFDIEPEQEVGPQLRRLGIGARDVRGWC